MSENIPQQYSVGPNQSWPQQQHQAVQYPQAQQQTYPPQDQAQQRTYPPQDQAQQRTYQQTQQGQQSQQELSSAQRAQREQHEQPIRQDVSGSSGSIRQRMHNIMDRILNQLEMSIEQWENERMANRNRGE